jgi:uncharacterized protein
MVIRRFDGVKVGKPWERVSRVSQRLVKAGKIAYEAAVMFYITKWEAILMQGEHEDFHFSALVATGFIFFQVYCSARSFMQILVDSDAMPAVVKEILYRAGERFRIPVILVANQRLAVIRSRYIKTIMVPAGADAADDRIVELVEAGDLVITADIPLADRVVAKGAYAINPRGELYTEENIKDRLATRDLLTELRSGGEITGGPSAFNQKDRRVFADQVDRFLTRRCR